MALGRDEPRPSTSRVAVLQQGLGVSVVQSSGCFSWCFKTLDGVAKQANSLISLTKITTCTGLDEHELDLLGRAKICSLTLTDETKGNLRASQRSLAVGYHWEEVVVTSHPSKRAVVIEGRSIFARLIRGFGSHFT